MPGAFPARIHALLASAARVGLVIRRGPSNHVATFLWNRERDTFSLGQWLKGRIYELRSDLSPDGKYFLYFAMSGRSPKTQGVYTAISEAPWLTVHLLFPHGHCWLGGGLWTGKRRFWLNGGGEEGAFGQLRGVERDEAYLPVGGYGAEDLSVYFPRLLRDGWEQHRDESLAEEGRRFHWERELRHGWVLKKVVHAGPAVEGRGCYWDEHRLENARTGSKLECRGWEWAERDGSRLVWASEGKLFAGDLGRDGWADVRELVDLDDRVFERAEAPYKGVRV